MSSASPYIGATVAYTPVEIQDLSVARLDTIGNRS